MPEFFFMRTQAVRADAFDGGVSLQVQRLGVCSLERAGANDWVERWLSSSLAPCVGPCAGRPKHEGKGGSAQMRLQNRQLAHLHKNDHPLPMQEARAAKVYSHFLRIACAIAKHNAIFRARYPTTDPLYGRMEKAISGAFWDMPLQLHVFWGAVEKRCSWEQHEEFANGLAQAIGKARRTVERPKRDRKGEIKWKRSVSFAQFALADEIEASARVFFTSVYSYCEAERPLLSSHEQMFWDRYRRLRCAVGRAKRDREDFYQVMMCLRARLPNEVCCAIVLMLI